MAPFLGARRCLLAPNPGLGLLSTQPRQKGLCDFPTFPAPGCPLPGEPQAGVGGPTGLAGRVQDAMNGCPGLSVPQTPCRMDLHRRPHVLYLKVKFNWTLFCFC